MQRFWVRLGHSGILFPFLLAVACTKMIVLPGADLPPSQIGELRARAGVEIVQIDEQPLEGHRFAIAPGKHSLRVKATKDLSDLNQVLQGIKQHLDCRFTLEINAGEKVSLMTRFRKAMTATPNQDMMWIELRARSSTTGNSRIIDSSRCASQLDCRGKDRNHIITSNCPS